MIFGKMRDEAKGPVEVVIVRIFGEGCQVVDACLSPLRIDKKSEAAAIL